MSRNRRTKRSAAQKGFKWSQVKEPHLAKNPRQKNFQKLKQDLIRKLGQLREEYGISPGKSNDRDRRRIANLVCGLLLSIKPDEILALLGGHRSIAGPGVSELEAALVAVARFEGEFYRALKEVNLECDPIEAEANAKVTLRQAGGGSAKIDPLKVHDIDGETIEQDNLPAGNWKVSLVNPNPGWRPVVLSGSDRLFALFESWGYVRDTLVGKNVSARFCALSDIVITVLSGKTIESKGEEHAREQQRKERPSEQDMEGAPVGVGASATSEWDIEDEGWGI